MRIEQHHGLSILCGGVIDVDKIKPGQRWIGSMGGIVTVTYADQFGWVKYEWKMGEWVEKRENDSVAFQKRYWLIIEPDQNIDEFMKRANITLLTYKKILMDWWDAGGLCDPRVVDRFVNYYDIEHIPRDRGEWERWIEQLLGDRNDVRLALDQACGPIGCETRGLCEGNLYLVPALVRLAIFHQWEHFSGNLSYPVPGQCVRFVGTGEEETVTDPQLVFYHYTMRSMYTGEYGEKRLHLKQYVADVIRATIAHVEQNIE